VIISSSTNRDHFLDEYPWNCFEKLKISLQTKLTIIIHQGKAIKIPGKSSVIKLGLKWIGRKFWEAS
jgi:hypothetical protein